MYSISEVMRIGSLPVCQLSKLWKAKFFTLCDVIFLVRVQGKFDIDHSWRWKGSRNNSHVRKEGTATIGFRMRLRPHYTNPCKRVNAQLSILTQLVFLVPEGFAAEDFWICPETSFPHAEKKKHGSISTEAFRRAWHFGGIVALREVPCHGSGSSLLRDYNHNSEGLLVVYFGPETCPRRLPSKIQCLEWWHR